MKRIESLDYLRGLMALSIMVYHYTSWTLNGVPSEYLLGKLGIYGVSIFYVLSGLSLGLVYNGRIGTLSDVVAFGIKRAYRIFPLFWLATTMAIGWRYASAMDLGKEWAFPYYWALWNYTLAFGFLDPMASLPIGGWSIGNEVVFYSILPLLLLLERGRRWAMPAAIAGSCLLAWWWTAHFLHHPGRLRDHWAMYIEAFNQAYLFFAGVAIARWVPVAGSARGRRVALVVAGVSLLAFTWYPVRGDLIGIVTGLPRLLLSIFGVAFVAAIYAANPQLSGKPARALSFLGECCYSIYLLHPLIGQPLVLVLGKIGVSKGVAFAVAVPLALAASALSYRFIEEPMMNRGKAAVKRWKAFCGRGGRERSLDGEPAPGARS